jgi:hypothetical protein
MNDPGIPCLRLKIYTKQGVSRLIVVPTNLRDKGGNRVIFNLGSPDAGNPLVRWERRVSSSYCNPPVKRWELVVPEISAQAGLKVKPVTGAKS